MSANPAEPRPRYKPYRQYKDSGVEWLGEIPMGWILAALSRITFSRCDGPFGTSLKSEHYSPSGVRVVRLQNIGSAEFKDTDSVFIDETYARQLGDHGVRAGDLLVAGLGDEAHPVGRACVAPDGIEPAMVKADCFRFRLDHRRGLPRFVAYQMSSTAADTAGAMSTGATRSRMNLTTTSTRHLALPSIEEQRHIADFLDREMARIDGLVAKKERLIELLQEKRSALISRAVTKGLDPNVPMKDSGVEWLGKIPAHWGVIPLKRVFTNLDHRRIPLSSDERAVMAKEYPYYGASGIIDQVENYLFDEPLILVAEDGANLYSRSTPLAFVATGKYWVNNHAHIIRPHDGMVNYWVHLLGSIVFDPWITGSAQPKLTSEILGAICLPIAPVSEREAILAFVDSHAARVDALVAKVRTAIDRLRELRTALISAAVTGKIDVRQESP
jgi:type I restriction enzyme, S subunit